jgi:CRP-like cAMP-binding protein
MIETESITTILRKVPVWSGLSESSLEQLAAEIDVVEVGPGDAVFREGDPGDSMYIIADGLVRVHCGERNLKKLAAPQFFGEMALFESAPRSASVSAIEQTTLLRLHKQAFLQLLNSRIDVAIGMLLEFNQRLNGYMATVGSLRNFIERDLLPLGVAL